MQKLEAGSSYWIHFQHPKGKRAFPTTIVEVDGQLMGSDIDAKLFNLPDNILEVHKMNEFIRLQWLSRAYRRRDQPAEADEFEARSYRAMPDEFYRMRLERLVLHWDMAGGVRSRAVQEEIERLQTLRPDIPIDDLPCMQRMIEHTLGNLIQPDDLVYPKEPSLWNRISNFFSRRFS